MYSVEVFEAEHYTLHINSNGGIREWGSFHHNIVWWVAENNIGPFGLDVDSKTQSGRVIFDSDSDAMAFKLAWT